MSKMAVDGTTIVFIVLVCCSVLGLVSLLQSYCPGPPPPPLKQNSSDHR